ncbi:MULTISPECIES: transcriptional activator NhaR [Comamonadaceae]|jgi:LysR family transcriptional activator of nhaA|uniref:transcriptional activator NhaR n=1 Tax=Comamonadaceae TaxID=80864 RepID=UPI001B382760|nr:transcriptional activator NhaR [Comamonas aquatica]QTX22550.1 transcriptional activator NhaR [Comamonas aquatica]
MNYKHLHYFLQVAKLGSVQRASERLHLSPQTISGQIQLLEEALGKPLFSKSGRGLVLTDVGRVALGYAEDIFSTGAELEEAVREHPRKDMLLEFRVGVVDAVPKTIACRLIEPASQLPEPVRIVCREWKLDTLLGELALHRLDLVISDAPIPSTVSIRAFNHKLGSCGVSFFAAPSILAWCTGRFPGCLDGAPLIMPAEESAVGQRLRAWLHARSLHPRVVGQCDDSALAKEFGRRGMGIFAGPTVLQRDIEKQYGVRAIGATHEVVEEFFAISVERRITHPCVTAITEAARNELFAPPTRRRPSARASA